MMQKERSIAEPIAPRKKVPLGFTRDTFPPGTHMCYIYNDEDERNRIIFGFLESGLLNGEKVSCFMDASVVDELKEHRTAAGIGKLYEEHQGHLSLSTTREAYYPDGIFVPDDTLDRLCKFYTKSIDEGYAGVRVTAEMSWAARGVPGSPRLMEYEARLNSTLRNCPVTAICQYNAKHFDNRMLQNILAVHPMIISHGRIAKNPYYIKGWWLLKRYLGLDQ